MLCQERQVQISSVSVCVCAVPDHNVCSRLLEVYEFMGAPVNRIVRANGNQAVVNVLSPAEGVLCLGGWGGELVCVCLFFLRMLAGCG